MLISKNSTFNSEKHYVTFSVDQYLDHVIKGILIWGEASEGSACAGFLDFIWQMEQIFAKQGGPAASVNKRMLTAEKPAGAAATAGYSRRNGCLATFVIQVQYRQNASWQGRMVHKETKEKYIFRSYRQLMNQICGILEDKPAAGTVSAADSYMELLAKDLTRCLADEESSGNYLEIQNVYPSILFCRYRYNGHSTSLGIRLKFHANSSWQGIIYWKKLRREIKFRSFLELVLLMSQTPENVMDEEPASE